MDNFSKCHSLLLEYNDRGIPAKNTLLNVKVNGSDITKRRRRMIFQILIKCGVSYLISFIILNLNVQS